jgi:hypothetical protein
MPQHLIIRLGTDGDLELKFQIHDTPVAQSWVERMQARGHYPLDHPDRFYGFGTPAQEQNRAVEYIQSCIATINAHETIIHRPFEYTQDCLNYLHNIFEQYHGLLDQQDTDYWNQAPDTVRKALAELNLAVHRCESVASGTTPRFVCTWYGMPKIHQLELHLQDQYTASQVKFGTVYLNYCEIGKTVEDLANDNDKYISDEAFCPFDHYSADFNVQFQDQDLTLKYGKIQKYIDQHRDFFLAHGITSVYNTQARPIRLPVADLIYDGSQEQLLAQIAKRQWVQQVTIE